MDLDILDETALSTSEAAEFLGVTGAMVRHWFRRGTADGIRLEAVRVGGSWRTSREACQRFVLRCTELERKKDGIWAVPTTKQQERAHRKAKEELDKIFGARRLRNEEERGKK